MSHLLFTADFHELVKGKLLPGTQCRINFDPRRFEPQVSNYFHGSENMPISAHCTFWPSNQHVDIVLASETGLLRNPVERMDGTGSMLSGYIDIPANTEEIEIWFSLNQHGTLYYDSEGGLNYHFRFIDADIAAFSVVITRPKKKGVGCLQASFTTIPKVESIELYYRVINQAQAPNEIALALTVDIDSPDKRIWSAKEELPSDAVIVYDFVYVVGGNKFLHNNNGNYFIVE